MNTGYIVMLFESEIEMICDRRNRNVCIGDKVHASLTLTKLNCARLLFFRPSVVFFIRFEGQPMVRSCSKYHRLPWWSQQRLSRMMNKSLTRGKKTSDRYLLCQCALTVVVFWCRINSSRYDNMGYTLPVCLEILIHAFTQSNVQSDCLLSFVLWR